MNFMHFTAFYRGLTRNRLYSFLNIAGLAVGIMAFLIMFMFVRFETSFEQWVPDHQELYLVRTNYNDPTSLMNGNWNSTMGGLLEQLKGDFSNLVGTRIEGGEGAGIAVVGGHAETVNIARVDKTFFDVFHIPMVRGTSAGALNSPNSAVISESAARHFFGTSNPIGQSLKLSYSELSTYQVTGVFRDFPHNSDFVLDILIPMPSKTDNPMWYHWGSTSLQTYLRVKTPAAAKALQDKFPSFVFKHAKDGVGEDIARLISLNLLPLADMHMEPEGDASSSKMITIITLAVVALATLLIAAVNYVNLATARISLRAREVAIRKVVGAGHGAIIRQFLTESMLTVAIASLVGLMLTELILPFLNAAVETYLTIPYLETIGLLAVVVLLVGLLAGLYPAILLSRYEAAAVLASSRSPSGGKTGARLRQVLVIAQFAIATTFLIVTTVIVAQTHHVRNSDIGFKRDGLIIVTSPAAPLVDMTQRRSFLAAVRDIPGVTSAAYANSAVGGGNENNYQNVVLPGVPGAGPSLKWEVVGQDFFKVMRPKLLAGRYFDDKFGVDNYAIQPKGSSTNIVINREAVAVLQLKSPENAIGKTVGGGDPMTVVGVVENMRFESPRTETPGTYYIYSPNGENIGNPVLSLRFNRPSAEVKAKLRTAWERLVPQVPFDAQTTEERLGNFYKDDDHDAILFSAGAVLAILIGCVGLWGLASFNTAQRTREIGIRKVLGASSSNIVRLLVGQFLRPVLLANLIAWPLAYYAADKWLAEFSDRIALSPLYFIAATLVTLVIALGTVIGQSLRASNAAPAWALRYE